MLPDPRFLKQPKHFWANVRSISQRVGYTTRQNKKKGIERGKLKVPTVAEIRTAFTAIDITTDHIADASDKLTPFGKTLLDYFVFRADALHTHVEPRLMDAAQAKQAYEKLRAKLGSTCPIVWNKQKAAKKAPAYLTCIVNMIVEANAGGFAYNTNPLELTTVTLKGTPLRTLARRVDGAFPAATNPIAIWEIKEYYYTTTFGSRVADGVYETLLDGMELEELREHENIDVKHLLMIDDRLTWWKMGKSYLCRMIDMLHMGYVDEILFGSEVLDRLPTVVKEWVAMAKKRAKGTSP